MPINTQQNTLNIRTPEGISFSFVLASPIIRMLAWIIDLFILMALAQIIIIPIHFIGIISPDFAIALQIISFFILFLGYHIFLEWKWNGQTLGKRILRLRVADEAGNRLILSQIVMRNLFRTVDALPFTYIVGGIAALFSKKYQRLGDFAAGTVVIQQPRIIKPDLKEISNGKYNSFRKHASIEALLRSKITPREASLALAALLRRSNLETHAQLQLFQELANHFKTKIDFPPELLDELSDEQLIRNIIDSLYRKINPHSLTA